MKRNLRQPKHEVRIGWFDGQAYGADNAFLPMAQVAQWVEEGHANGGAFAGTYTPARPAIRMYFMPALQQSTDLMEMSIPLVNQVALGRLSWRGLHQKIAPKLLYRFKLALDTIRTPANTPATVALKGHNKPWVDTGQLVSSVRFKIEGALKR